MRGGIVELFTCDFPGCDSKATVPMECGQAFADPPDGWLSITVHRTSEHDEQPPRLFCSNVCAVGFLTTPPYPGARQP